MANLPCRKFRCWYWYNGTMEYKFMCSSQNTRKTHTMSQTRKPSWRKGNARHTKMAVSSHLGFYRTGNSAIRSADPENPSLEANMEWIGCTVCEIFGFKLYCVLETGVRGHSRSLKAALFDTALTTLYSSSVVTIGLYLYLLPFPRYSRILGENC